MRRLAILSLAALVAGMAAPASALAWLDAPPSRSDAASTHKRVFAKPKGHTCEKCAAAAKAAEDEHHVHVPPPPGGMMEGARIVGCAHSSNGVCPTCRKILEMPGEVTMVSPGTTIAPVGVVATASGRAVASDSAPGRALATSEPEPLDVMRTTYRPGAAPGAPAQAAPAMPAPASRAPFLPEAHEGSPHILSHLFGFAAVGRDWRDMREMKARRKRETHAAVSYGPNAGKVEELPASMVYGKQDH